MDMSIPVLKNIHVCFTEKNKNEVPQIYLPEEQTQHAAG
jgi:hypothetical protein